MDVPSRVPPGCPGVFPGRYIPSSSTVDSHWRSLVRSCRRSGARGVPGCSPVGHGGFLWLPWYCRCASRRYCHRSGAPGVPGDSPVGYGGDVWQPALEASDVIAGSSRRSDRREDGGDLVGYPLEQ